jgi:hypothetical protein
MEFKKLSKMKKIFLYIIATALISTSCTKVFDVYPVASIADDQAINDKSSVEHALAGTYNALQQGGMYGMDFAIVGDLAADNLKWSGTSQDYGQIEDKPIPADNSIVEGMWASAYDGINRANNILNKLPEIGGIPESEFNQFKGEALFIRSLLYYNLTMYFGNVPLRLEPTSNLDNIDMAPSSRIQVLEQIILDLNIARDLLGSSKSPGRVNTYAASGLLAKANLTLFHINSDDANAEAAVTEATRVIEEGGYILETEYSNLFGITPVSTESIFEVVYDLQNFNRLAQYFFSRALIGRYEISPKQSFIDSFEEGDLRLSGSIRYDDDMLPYGAKYVDVAGGTDRVYVLRLADILLIRAEANAYMNAPEEVIKADINEVRNRAGLEDTQVSGIPQLNLAIESERNHELAFEGHRYIDLVRTKRAVSVLNIEEKYTLFPIPLSEVQTNNLMKQNIGY